MELSGIRGFMWAQGSSGQEMSKRIMCEKHQQQITSNKKHVPCKKMRQFSNIEHLFFTGDTQLQVLLACVFDGLPDEVWQYL